MVQISRRFGLFSIPFMKPRILAWLLAIIPAVSGCSPKTVTAPSTTHTQLTATAGGHYITADVEGVAGIHNYLTQAVITSRWGSLLVCSSGIYFGTNETTENRWTELPAGAPIVLHIAHDKFSAQWGANQITQTPSTAPGPAAAAS
jgi:hypothetical protein